MGTGLYMVVRIAMRAALLCWFAVWLCAGFLRSPALLRLPLPLPALYAATVCTI